MPVLYISYASFAHVTNKFSALCLFIHFILLVCIVIWVLSELWLARILMREMVFVQLGNCGRDRLTAKACASFKREFDGKMRKLFCLFFMNYDLLWKQKLSPDAFDAMGHHMLFFLHQASAWWIISTKKMHIISIDKYLSTQIFFPGLAV